VGDLQAALVAGDQPGGDQSFQQLFVFAVGGQQAARDPAPYRRPCRVGRHQPQHQVTGYPLLVRVQGRPHLVRGAGDRTPDAAGCLVALHGQGAALPLRPGFPERVREQRQGARLALDLPQQQVHQSRLE
jgi:hypothetical protein